MLVVPSLKLLLRMEGNANDASGNGNHGTVVGATLVGVGTHYDNGIEYVEWTTGYAAGTGSQSKESDHLYLYCPATNTTDRTYVTDNKIDLTNIAKIKVEWSSTNGDDGPYGMVLSVDNDKGQRARLDEEALKLGRPGKFTKQINEIDVSSISGDRHIKTAIEGASFDDKGVSEMEVYKVWLEDSNENIIQIDLGKFGKCYSFDGTDDYINIPYFAPPAELTLSAWVYFGTSNRDIIGYGDTTRPTGHFLGFRIDGNDKLLYGEYDGGWTPVVGGTILTKSKWYFVTATKNSSDLVKLYINGEEDNSGTVSRNPDVDTLSIGATRHSTVSNFFDGKIDCPMIFNRALAEHEIKRVMLLFPPTTGG